MKGYSTLSEITVKSQEEFDMIPDEFAGRIYIEFGVYGDRAVVNRRFKYRVVARENSSVVARENSSVVAWENSSVEARENSSVVAWENSSVEAWGNSSVVARGNSSVVARGNSSVVAWENSSVVASGNSQVVDMLKGAKVEVTGNARIVYMPKSIEDYMTFYGIKHDKKTAVFYKAVQKINGEYQSNHDRNFKYVIGEAVKIDCDKDVTEECSYGIHIAHLGWCLDFGSDWDGLAILEVVTNIADIVVPKGGNGKVRTSEVKVLREVPLEECGVYGKILAKRRS